MASKIQICNRALARMGEARITSFADNTNAAKILNAIYDDVAEDVMSKGAWPSCTFRATLAQSSDTPDWGYDYKYQLPTNPKCLLLLSINQVKPGTIDYRVENGYILTNENECEIQYIGFIEDTEAYDSFLKQAIIIQLQAELQYNRTGDKTSAEKFLDIAEKKIALLLGQAGVQGSVDYINSDTFLDARDE